MRFALWRRSKSAVAADPQPSVTAPAETPAPVRASPPPVAVVTTPRQSATTEIGDLDLQLIWRELIRKRNYIIGPTILAAIISIAAVNVITPMYKSESRILVDGRENIFLRPNGERSDDRSAVDPEAVTSQVQLLLSRDLAREVIRKNKLGERPEFDPVLQRFARIKSVLALFGVGRDPFRMSPEERVLDTYFDRLAAFAVDKSRVIVVEFQSRDPDLAAQVANSIADGYLELQQSARQNQAKSAGQWLSGEIENLRKKVEDAEQRAEEFRSKSSLFIGTNNTSLSNQQLGEISTQLNNARAQKSDAESKARLIRELLKTGRPIEASEVLNSELIRRLSEQRVTLRGQLAEQSATLLDRHPRIKELRAQVNDIDGQIRDEAGKISRALENDARIASAKLESLTANLDQVKRQAGSSNGQDVQLRALEREAKAQRDLLESYLAKYREATARENIDAAPADGRVISRAVVTNNPSYPKKLPIVLIVTLATLLLTSGYIATSELLRMTAPTLPRKNIDAAVVSPGVAPAVAQAPPAPQVQPVVTTSDLRGHPSEIEALAASLRTASKRKMTVLGQGRADATSLTALTLARLLARQAKVVLVDLAAAPSVLSQFAMDSAVPSLADLMQGRASFGQIITRDRHSPVHLVCSSRSNSDRALLQSPRLTMAIDALQRSYDYVLLNAGSSLDLPAALLASDGHAVVVPAAGQADDARKAMAAQLRTIGFSEVTVLQSAFEPSAHENGSPKVIAA